MMAAPSTRLHFVENQAVPTFCSCLFWCPYMNLKEFSDGLIEYFLRKNIFEGKHFLEDWRVSPFFSLMVHSYPPQWLLDPLVFLTRLSWWCADSFPSQSFCLCRKEQYCSTVCQTLLAVLWGAQWMDCMHTNWNCPVEKPQQLHFTSQQWINRDMILHSQIRRWWNK